MKEMKGELLSIFWSYCFSCTLFRILGDNPGVWTNSPMDSECDSSGEEIDGLVANAGRNPSYDNCWKYSCIRNFEVFRNFVIFRKYPVGWKSFICTELVNFSKINIHAWRFKCFIGVMAVQVQFTFLYIQLMIHCDFLDGDGFCWNYSDFCFSVPLTFQILSVAVTMNKRKSSDSFFDTDKAFNMSLEYEFSDDVFVSPELHKYLLQQGIKFAVNPKMFLPSFLVATANAMGMSKVFFYHWI